MTSRIRRCRQLNTVGSIPLEGLGDDHSVELLIKAANIPTANIPSQYSAAHRIVRLVGSLTIALIIAGAYINFTSSRLEDYPQEHQRQLKRFLEFQPTRAPSRFGSVEATFEPAVGMLIASATKSARHAILLLDILSMLDSSPLPLKYSKMHGWEPG
jgi:hypothetical protein